MSSPMIARELQATLRKAYDEAQRMRHEYVTLEHLLLALLDDPKASKAHDACGANRGRLRKKLYSFFDDQPKLPEDVDAEPHQTLAVERVLQRAAIHAISSEMKVIDGANVGFHKLNYAGAPERVEYEQIEWVARHFERMNDGTDGAPRVRVLIVIHSRHVDARNVPPEAVNIVRGWRQRRILYCCAPGNNDDWYWLYAAVAAGPGSLLVSNDEMRDHHFGMLSARAFLVWKERHLAKFELGGWRRDGGRDVTIHDPPPFSVRAQRNDPGEALARWGDAGGDATATATATGGGASDANLS